jgi:hypothetical protein
MAADSTRDLDSGSKRGDLLIATLAWVAASAGLLSGGTALWVALVILAIPMAAFVVFGHLAGRGAVVACLASAFGMGMVVTGPGASPWAAIALIGVVDFAALVAGTAAVRMVPATSHAAPLAERQWISIVVRHSAATPALVNDLNPFTSLLPDPRRSRRGRSRRPTPLERSA